MKQMQCSALNIKTTTKQVWLHFIRRTTRPGCAGTTTNLQIVFNTQKNPNLNPRLNQAPQKNISQIFLPKKIPESKISNPKNSFDHPRRLKSGVPPWLHPFILLRIQYNDPEPGLEHGLFFESFECLIRSLARKPLRHHPKILKTIINRNLL